MSPVERINESSAYYLVNDELAHLLGVYRQIECFINTAEVIDNDQSAMLLQLLNDRLELIHQNLVKRIAYQRETKPQQPA